MWYRVLAKEIHVVSVLVEADNEEEALKLVELQEGLEEFSEFLEPIDRSEWEIDVAEDVDQDGNYLAVDIDEVDCDPVYEEGFEWSAEDDPNLIATLESEVSDDS
jgi:hypothetical protein